MGTPARTSIILGIQTALNTISIANSYNTDVVTVDPFLRTRDDVDPGLRPYLAFGLGRETFEHQSFRNARIQAPLVIVGYISTDDWTAASSEINLLVDDVIALINSDPTFGGNAVSTKLDGLETDEADPDRASTTGWGCAFVMECTLTFFRDTTAS